MNQTYQHVLTTSVNMKLHVSQDTYLVNDQCRPPEMRIQPCDIEALLAILRVHNLVTDLVFPDVSKDSDVQIWREFNVKLNDHLSLIGAEFADPSSFSSCDLSIPNQNASTEYHNLPWVLLMGGRASHGRRSIVPSGPIIFSPRTLCSNQVGGTWGKAASGTPNQPLLLIGASTIANQSCLCANVHLLCFVIGCRFTEIDAPITTFPDTEDSHLVHRCFAIRVYEVIGARLTGRISAVIDCRGGNRPCFDETPGSPTPSPPLTPPPSGNLTDRFHPRSPQSNVSAMYAAYVN